MAGKFLWKKFSDINLEDAFFDTLKEDYEEFPQWYKGKIDKAEEALVCYDDMGLTAFMYLKDEEETLELADRVLPLRKRLKIGTLKLSERQRGVRLGEGAIGVALWKWQEKRVDEIYLTVFEKQEELIGLIKRFGFVCCGKNKRGEQVFIKDRRKIDYSDPYKSFPFITPNFSKAGIIPIEEGWHDALFPYSELSGTAREVEEITAGNGITKVYIGKPWSATHYAVGEPVVIYRIYNGTGKGYRSVVTSYGTISKITHIKMNYRYDVSKEDFLRMAGNKTVFRTEDLLNIYCDERARNIEMIEIIYDGFFGKGHNVNYNTLKAAGLFEDYPYKIDYTKEQFIKILEMGEADVQNIIID